MKYTSYVGCSVHDIQWNLNGFINGHIYRFINSHDGLLVYIYKIPWSDEKEFFIVYVAYSTY